MTSPTATAEIERLVDRLSKAAYRAGEFDGEISGWAWSARHERDEAAAALLAALRAAEAERDAARADRDSHQRVGIAAMESLAECAKFLEIFEDTVWDWHINEQSSKRAAAAKLRVDEFNAVLARARAALQSTSAKEGK